MMEDDRETPPININTVDSSNQGYVKSSRKYFVTDNLEVFPSSDSLALLKKLKVENMSSLDSIELRVGTDEVNTPLILSPHIYFDDTVIKNQLLISAMLNNPVVTT